MSDDLREWPESMRRIAQTIGPELTRELASRAGGIGAVYIPREPRDDHPWAVAIGLTPFAALCRALGGERIELPRGASLTWKKAEIFELAEQGVSRRQIALRLGVTIRHVRRTLQGLSFPDPRQQRLFGDLD